MVAWFSHIGFPQHAAEALYLSYMNHIPHRKGTKKENNDRKIEASSLILHHLSAPPEHKIKMLYELEKLK